MKHIHAWKRKVSLCITAALFTLVIASGCGVSSFQGQAHTIQMQGAIAIPGQMAVPAVPGQRQLVDTWNSIHLFQDFDYRINNPQSIAHYYDFVWGADPARVAAFRAGNPNIVLSYYISFFRDSGIYSNLDAYHNLAYWKAIHPDWILYRCDRVTPAYEDNLPNIPFVFANPHLIPWQVQTYALQASQQGYDALAADNLNLENLIGACGFYQNGRWVQRYTGAMDDPQWRADILTWVTRMQSALHALPHPLALVPNLGLGGAPLDDPSVTNVINHVDGVLDEGGFTNYGHGYVSDASWLTYVHFIEAVQQQNRPYYIVNEFNGSQISNADIQWALSSYLMAKRHLASIFISTQQYYGADSRFPAYGARIGSPQGELYQSQGVYWRNYSGGLVVVNPSSTTSYTVSMGALGNTYTNLFGGSIGRTITLPPHSGLILASH